jgi:hypothetical protein
MPLRKKPEYSNFADHINHPNLANYSFPPKPPTFPHDFPQPSRARCMNSARHPGEQPQNFNSVQSYEENEEFGLSPAFQASFGNRQRAGNHYSCAGPQAAAGPTGTKAQIPFNYSSQSSFESQESYEETNGPQNSLGHYNQPGGASHKSYEDLAVNNGGAIYNVAQPSNRPRYASYGRTQGHWYQKPNVSAPELTPAIHPQSYGNTAKYGGQRAANVREEDPKHKASRATYPINKNLNAQAAHADKPRQPYYTAAGGKGYAQGFAHMPCGVPPYIDNQTSAANAKDWGKGLKSCNAVPDQYPPPQNGVRQQGRSEGEDKLTSLGQQKNSFSNKVVGKPATLNRGSGDHFESRAVFRHDSGFAGNKYGGPVGMSQPTSNGSTELQHPNSSFRSNDSYGGLWDPKNYQTHSGRCQDQHPSKPSTHNAAAHKSEGERLERQGVRDDYQQSSTSPSQNSGSTASSKAAKMTEAEFCQLMKKAPPTLTKASPVLAYFADIMAQGEEIESIILKMVQQTSSDKMKEAITPKPKSTKQEMLQAAKVFHERIVKANQGVIDAVNANKKLNCENPSPFQDLDLERVKKCYDCVSSHRE